MGIRHGDNYTEQAGETDYGDSSSSEYARRTKIKEIGSRVKIAGLQKVIHMCASGETLIEI